MTFPVFSAQSATGYYLDRSLRFRASASAYLNRTPASAGDRRTWTWSNWVKRGILGAAQSILDADNSIGGGDDIRFNADNTFTYFINGAATGTLTTTQVFRDPSAWYHIVLAVDTTQATASNRLKLYINGSQVTSFSTATYPAQNSDTDVNTATQHRIAFTRSSQTFDGYLTEINFIDGQALTPSSFGENNSSTGVWQPKKYTGTYGTNGYYLPFTDNSALTTSSNVGLGKDFSGNGNYWTTNNISITSGVTYDSMTDVPTLTNATTANYATLNPLYDAFRSTISGANLNFSLPGGSGGARCRANWIVPTGKWYWESVVTSVGSYPNNMRIGFVPDNTLGLPFYIVFGTGVITTGGYGTLVANGTSYANGDIIQIAFDKDAGKVWFGKNGTWSNSGNPSAGTNENVNSVPTTTDFNPGWDYNVTVSAASGSVNFGQRPLSYSPPTGFNVLNTFNLPTPTIGATASSQAGDYMNTVLWTGNGSQPRAITGVGFQPDFVWMKNRATAYYHQTYDVLRGTGTGGGVLYTNVTDAVDDTYKLASFDSDGVTLGTNLGNVNNNGEGIVGWFWKANGTGVTNTAGSITSTVSANTTSGFSVVTYTGTGSAATIGHGLGISPRMIIVKRRNSTGNWAVFHSNAGSEAIGFLNTSDAFASPDTSYWNGTSPTSSVFSVGNNSAVNASGGTYVAYVFSQVSGYSSISRYTGNGSTDGTFAYTGFNPKYIMIKNRDSAQAWQVYDAARSPNNLNSLVLFPNLANAEQNSPSAASLDALSNGFKLRVNDAGSNSSGGAYLYLAFAQNPFKYSLAR
jgi:hypothetical protein